MLEAGSIVGDKYRLVAQIGEGGMGVVWRAKHEHLGHDVAVKFLNRIASESETIAGRFLDEARTAVSVRHRNVVQILDFGIADDERPYMVMEFLEGESLADRIARKPPLSIAETSQTVGLTLSGLAAVHDRGIVHRDLKPENIFLTYDADGFFPKILDFGVSKDLARDGEGSRGVKTREGVLLGTPQYMSPEQARGLRDIDRRSDIYSMGVILYELLTGVSPFDAENVGDILMKVMKSDYPRLGRIRQDLPKALVDVVERAMALDREARFPDAREMRNGLFAAIATWRPSALAAADPTGALHAELASAMAAVLARTTTPASSSVPNTPPTTPVDQAGPAGARARVSATSIDETIPFQAGQEAQLQADADGAPPATAGRPTPVDTGRPAEPTGILATPRITLELKKERNVPLLLVLTTFAALLAVAAIELRAPGTIGGALRTLFGGGDTALATAPGDAGVVATDAGVDAGETIRVRLRPVPADATVTIAGRVYGPSDLAPLRNGAGLVTFELPQSASALDIRVDAPGFEVFEESRDAHADLSFRLRLRPLDAGFDAGSDAGADAGTAAATANPRRRRGR